MTVENIHVDDPDSLEAAADALHFRESYGDYSARVVDELAQEDGVDPDDDTHDYAWSTYNPDRTDGLCLLVTVAPVPDPEPPSPAAPALPLAAPSAPCTLCPGYGVVAMVPRTGASGRPCWYCGGSGEDPDPAEVPATPVTDRIEHLRRIGQTGGMTTCLRYGSNHFRTLGKAGYAATVKAHGAQYARDLLRAKGWSPRKPDLLTDLRAGRQLADLDRAA